MPVFLMTDSLDDGAIDDVHGGDDGFGFDKYHFVLTRREISDGTPLAPGRRDLDEEADRLLSIVRWVQ